MSLIPTIKKLWPGNAEPDGNSVRHINLAEEEIRPFYRRIIGNEPPVPTEARGRSGRAPDP